MAAVLVIQWVVWEYACLVLAGFLALIVLIPVARWIGRDLDPQVDPLIVAEEVKAQADRVPPESTSASATGAAVAGGF